MLLRKLVSFNTSVMMRRCSQKIDVPNSVKIDYLSGSDKGIVVLGLNNSKTKNALCKSFTRTLNESLDDISLNSSTRVLVIRSSVPKVFCAGANLKERQSMTELQVKAFVSSLRNLMFKIENVSVPTIAAIDGAALGGGLELALSCDIRIASASSKLGLVETKLAILPGAGGTQRLPRLIGVALAKELIFTARILNGKEAKTYGIVNHCVEDNNEGDSGFLRAIDVAREILPNGPIAVRMAKIAINKGIEVDINQGCAVEELCYAQVIPTKDRIEGLQAFQEKRKPLYIGE